MQKLVALFTLLIGLHANAGLIKIEVDKTNVLPGESVLVTLVAQGLTGFDSFDFDFNFDDSLFSFDGNVTSDLTLGIFGLSFQELTGLGSVAFSYLDFFPYAGASNFTLAQFSLSALDIGTGSFDITDSLFGELVTGPIDVDTSDSATVGVPAPAALGFFALAGLLMLTRHRSLS